MLEIIRRDSGDTYTSICAGVILNTYYILTVAHCLYAPDKSLPKEFEIIVHAGAIYRDRDEPTNQKIKVCEFLEIYLIILSLVRKGIL